MTTIMYMYGTWYIPVVIDFTSVFPLSMKLVHLALVALASALEDGSASFYAASAAAVDPRFNNTAGLNLLTEYVASTGAMCLDGSPGAYYFRPGFGNGTQKWYIHHQGGGWCESWDDCHGRSTTQLGSSRDYTQTENLGGGYFDANPSINPMMYNWNMVQLRYCDGGSFSGNNDTVATYKGRKLYFRGKRVREATLDSLRQKHGLGAATDVVISGCSAGGLATFLHTDQWCDALGKTAPVVKCVGMPDSGFFLDFEDPRRLASPVEEVETTAKTAPLRLGNTVSGDYHRVCIILIGPARCLLTPIAPLTVQGLKWVFATMNATAGINQDCVASKQTGGPSTDSPSYLCMFAEHTAPFTHTPLFPLQSEYDSWQTGHVLYYPNTGADVSVLGANITRRLHANLLGPHRRSGAFLDSCWHHCGMWGSIRIGGDLVATAFQKWYDGLGRPGEEKVPKQTTWVQGQPYKCDKCCQP